MKKQESVSSISSRLSELEKENNTLIKEQDNYKKRIENLVKKDKLLREELKTLRAKIIKRPLASARSDKSDVSSKEQLLIKKSSNLEKEVDELKQQLEKQISINETHKARVAKDFEQWNKQKYWQQSAEKYKNKLKEKNEELIKLQQTCGGYRVLIERLEREKHSLENRLKNLKTFNIPANISSVEKLQFENMKLQNEVEALTSRLEIQQQHSGALGAVMLQEKLEAQERKIAVLELSAKVIFTFLHNIIIDIHIVKFLSFTFY